MIIGIKVITNSTVRVWQYLNFLKYQGGTESINLERKTLVESGCVVPTFWVLSKKNKVNLKDVLKTDFVPI